MSMDGMVRVVLCDNNYYFISTYCILFCISYEVYTSEFSELSEFIIYTSTGYEPFYNLIGSLLVEYIELNVCEFQVLLENSAPITTEKAKKFGMKVFNGK